MILVSSGGSGGHVLPAYDFLNDLIDAYYLGSKSELEIKLFKNSRYPYLLIKGRGSDKIFKCIYYFIKNNIYLYFKLKKLNIDKIITFGGYSVSYLFLYLLLNKKPLYLVEENKVLGRANRLLLRRANKVFLQFSNIIKLPKKYQDKCLFCGNFRKVKKLDLKKDLVVFLSGSKGSETLNEIYEKVVKKINYPYKILKGNRDFEMDIFNYLNRARVVVSRGGASSLGEIEKLKIPSIIIPSPYVIDNHQYHNAYDYYLKNKCILIEEANLNTSLLASKIKLVYENEFLRESIISNLDANDDCFKIIKKEMGIDEKVFSK